MAAVRDAATAAEHALSRVTARARDVLAALAADPCALDAVPSSDDPGAALTASLQAAVTGLTDARAELKASLDALTAAAAAAPPKPPPSDDVAALEATVAALRAEVATRNAAVRDLSDSLAALVADVDSWRAVVRRKEG